MVDLPIPDQNEVTAQAPTNRVSGFQYARAGNYLASGLDRLSSGLDALAVPAAQQEAASALQSPNLVTRDAQGNITVGKPQGLPILGPAGEAYNHAIAAGTLAAGDNLASQDIAQIRAATEGNPAAFKQQTDAYSQNLLARNPGPVGQAMAQRADSLATQHFDGMVQQQATIGVANAKQSIVDARTASFNELAALAQQSGTDTPQYATAYAKYSALGQQLVKNPAFGISAAVQAANDKADHDLLQGYAVTGAVDKDMKGPGGIIQARQNLADSVRDPGLDLTEAQRQHLMAVGEARIQFNVGQNASDVAANKENVRALEQAAKAPGTSAQLSEPVWQAALAKSQSLGDSETTQQLAAMHLQWQHENATRGLSPNQALNSAGLGAAGGAADPGATPGYSYNGAVIQHESGGGKNLGDPAHAYGLAGFMPGTWRGLMEAHPELGLSADGRADPAQVDKALSAVHADSSAKLTAAGIAPTDKNVFMTHFLGDGGAVKFFQASKDNAGQAFADVFPKEAAANPTIAYAQGPGGGQGAPRSLAQVYSLMTKSFAGTPTVAAPSANGTPYTPDQLRQNPWLLSTYVRSIADDPANRAAYGEKIGNSILQSINGGIMPSVAVMANYAQLAQASPQLAEQAGHIQASVQATALANQAINLPPGQGQAYISAITQAAQGGSIMQSEVARQARDFYDKGVKSLKEDPWGTAVAKGWDGGKGAPAPLQFDNPQSLAVAMHQRSDLASSIAARTGDNMTSALAPKEIEQVKSLVSTGSPQQLGNLAQAISTLPEARQRATLAAIGQTGGDGRVFAVAGALQSVAPQVASDVMAGQALLKEKAEYGPPPDKVNAELERYLPSTLFPPSDRANGQSGREIVSSAVNALYAKMSADAGDATKTLNPTRYKAAVDAVTGGMVRINGNSLAPPWYQAGQAGMSNALGLVNDTDLSNSQTREGTPLPALALRPPGLGAYLFGGTFKLENNAIGDGKYRIYSGPPNAKAYVMDKRGGPFLLDLAGKRADVEAQQAQAARPMPAFVSQAPTGTFNPLTAPHLRTPSFPAP